MAITNNDQHTLRGYPSRFPPRPRPVRGPVAAETALLARWSACQTSRVPDSKPNGGQMCLRSWSRPGDPVSRTRTRPFPESAMYLVSTKIKWEGPEATQRDHPKRKRAQKVGAVGQTCRRVQPRAGRQALVPCLGCHARSIQPDTSKNVKDIIASENKARQAASPRDPGIPATVVMILRRRT